MSFSLPDNEKMQLTERVSFIFDPAGEALLLSEQAADGAHAAAPQGLASVHHIFKHHQGKQRPEGEAVHGGGGLGGDQAGSLGDHAHADVHAQGEDDLKGQGKFIYTRSVCRERFFPAAVPARPAVRMKKVSAGCCPADTGDTMNR